MAHKLSAGSTHLGRDSQSKRLGAKLHDGQTAKTGQIIFRQRGTKVHPGKNVRRGKDDTLYAAIPGLVTFTRRKVRAFDGALKLRTFANVGVPKKVAAPSAVKIARKAKAPARAKAAK